MCIFLAPDVTVLLSTIGSTLYIVIQVCVRMEWFC